MSYAGVADIFGANAPRRSSPLAAGDSVRVFLTERHWGLAGLRAPEVSAMATPVAPSVFC